MTNARMAGEDRGWDELLRTAEAVRELAAPPASPPRRRRLLLLGGAAALLGGVLLLHHPAPAAANSSYDSDLFSLTNQDRASNGVASLRYNSTLQYIGENGPYSGCSGAGRIYGRSEDMINRDYFSHPIPPCGQYVFSIMSAYGIRYLSAGENIGWESGASNPPSYLNGEFMNSPEHRANILNGNYTDLGIGSWGSGSSYWTGSGSPGYQNVWMFSEEFAQLSHSVPSTPAPTPAPTAPPRNSPAPPTPAATPIATAAPQPPPSSTPVPNPPAPQTAALPLLSTSQGVIPDAVLSVLEAYLLD